MGYRLRRRGAALGVLASAALAVAALTPAHAAVPIPSTPGPLLVPSYIGAPATADPIASFTVPQNPHLAPNPISNIHNDAYGTNSYPGPGPIGHSPRVSSAFYGLQECATSAFDAAGRIVGLCPALRGSSLLLIDPVTLDRLASFPLPPRHVKAGSNPLTDLCGGAYFYLDNQNRAVVDTTARTIEVVADTGASFTLQHTYDLTAAIPSTDCMIALMPDWGGRIWFLTSHGIVGNVDPVTSAVHTLSLTGEIIDNSFSVDETGGVFVVSDHAMYRFDAAADGAPAITWRQPYDRGSVQKPGQLAQGSGTTPTLVGTDEVAITDNADPQMHVIVYHRSAASGGAQVCSTGVFQPGSSDTENSLVAVGNALFVENNYGYQGPQSTLLGKTTSPGIARVDVTGNSCSTVWTNSLSAPTSVPKASLANGLLYVYTKPHNALGIDAWYFTAIDMRTGATAFEQLAGTGPQFNNHYASIYLGPDGAAYVPVLSGMVRIKDS
ncbi:MAG TPA: hypothetical protein VGN35_09985 [Jatrophihabitantaceae bacterium]|jgi:hypothetical protein|nr:hypothetical protein [Jatrophihabitantaceae bacterium]